MGPSPVLLNQRSLLADAERVENLELRTRYHGAGQKWCCNDCGSVNVSAVRLAA